MTCEAERARQVVYLTGAPATGKTTATEKLTELGPIHVFSYGALLTARVPSVQDQPELRRRSADAIRESDVVDLDAELIGMLAATEGHCIIDSHAVTKEETGFRVVPYSIAGLRSLGITAIVCLYAQPGTIAARIQADPQRLEQMMTNLLGNAIRYTRAGGSISLSVQQVGDEIVLKVQDDGVGLEPSEATRIFRPFVHSDDGRSNPEGLGLGLFLVKTLAEGHGGSIACTSGGRDRGSEFTLRLPVNGDRGVI